jgi:hypothetical protein
VRAQVDAEWMRGICLPGVTGVKLAEKEKQNDNWTSNSQFEESLTSMLMSRR